MIRHKGDLTPTETVDLNWFIVHALYQWFHFSNVIGFTYINAYE